jgi:Dyp-type peroxidase family
LPGAPVALFPEADCKDKEKAKTLNSFEYTEESLCPLAAHTRKTNPRITDRNDPTGLRAKIVRNGIPYGSEFKEETASEERGLLFACYQSHIESGFQFIQKSWSNDKDFPRHDAGHDPIIGQTSGPKLPITIVDAQQKAHRLPAFAELVTLKGGDYFFVPSILALQTILGQD